MTPEQLTLPGGGAIGEATGRPGRPAGRSSSIRRTIAAAGEAILDHGRDLTLDELSRLADLDDTWVPSLAAVAHQVRLERCGDAVHVESILSAKTGGCPEDCHFCSQSSRFDSPVRAVAPVKIDDVLASAAEAAKSGATEFCVVYAVRGPDERLMERLEALAPVVKAETGCNLAVSAGVLSLDQARRLAAAGVHRYNHNLETARSFFPSVVTSHTWDERFGTCRVVREAGMQLCSGVLLGMGESSAQRVELLGQLRDADPCEVPVNFLNPRVGTPLGGRPLVRPLDALRWIALVRLALPGVVLRYAGGREVTLGELQAMGLTSGINALIVGNYLTSLGRPPEDDLALLSDLAMPLAALSGAF